MFQNNACGARSYLVKRKQFLTCKTFPIWFSGGLVQIDSGPFGIVYGVNNRDMVYCRNGITRSNPTGSGWTQVTSHGRLKYVSCCPYGCWGVNSADQIWFRGGVTPTKCDGDKWIHISGGLRQIEVM